MTLPLFQPLLLDPPLPVAGVQTNLAFRRDAIVA
jgi:hypothetical protein